MVDWTRGLLATTILLAMATGCSATSGGRSDGGADSSSPAACTRGQPVRCPCPASTSMGTRACTDAGLGACTGCGSPLDGGVDSSAADARTGARDSATRDGPTDSSAPSDAAMCTPDDLTCEASAECCNSQCVGGVCCFQPSAAACGTACVASGSGLVCTHDYDCCGEIFGSTCKSGLCCNAIGQLCNGNNAWCCSGVCSGTTCS